MTDPIYAARAFDYRNAGWLGVVPVPPRDKEIRTKGFSGRNGVFPSGADIQAWIEDKPHWNIALRLPHGVIGIDVDAYAGKVGGRTLMRAQAEWGNLPDTWRSSSRDDDAISGIRLFRVPEDAEFKGVIAFGNLADVEIIQYHHRYMVVAPSVHPNGGVYRWHGPDGLRTEEIPRLDDLPELPAKWLAALRVDAPVLDVEADVSEALASLPAGKMGIPVQQALVRALNDLRMKGSRHDSTRDNVLRLLRLADQGEKGVREALEKLRRSYVDVVSERDAGPEFDRMVTGQTGHNLIASSPSLNTDNFVTRESLWTPGVNSFTADKPVEVRADFKGPSAPILTATVQALDSDEYDLSDIEPIEPSGNSGTLTKSGLLAGGVHGDWIDSQVFAPLEWVVPGILTEGFGILAGSPKIGKSFLVANIALACAGGGSALGSIEVDHRPVFYLALEDGYRRLQTRFRNLLNGGPIPRDVFVMIKCEQYELQDTIAEYLEVHKGEKPMIILDTLGKARPPKARGEDAYQMDYALAGSLKGLVDDHPGATLLAVHHTRKAEGADVFDSISGTQGLPGAADFSLVLRRKRKSNQGSLILTGRDVPENEYALVTDNGLWSLDGDDLDEAAQAIEDREEEEQQEKKARRHSDRSMEIVALVEANGEKWTSPLDVVTALHINRDTASKYLGRLADSGMIRRGGRGVFLPLNQTDTSS